MSALAFIVDIFFDLYILILIIRLLMQKMGASYHNTFLQFVFTFTEPVIKPFRRFLPGFKGFDLAIIGIAFILELMQAYLLLFLQFKLVPGLIGAILLAVAALCLKFINVFFWATIIAVLLSWIPNLRNNPLAEIIEMIAEPVMGLGRRFIPAIRGFDFSPIVVLIVLQLIAQFVIVPIVTIATQIAL